MTPLLKFYESCGTHIVTGVQKYYITIVHKYLPERSSNSALSFLKQQFSVNFIFFLNTFIHIAVWTNMCESKDNDKMRVSSESGLWKKEMSLLCSIIFEILYHPGQMVVQSFLENLQ